MIKILFICHGNICRSPMALYYFRSLLKEILFICHGSILKSLEKASKINDFMKHLGAYYTTTKPFEFRSEP